MTAVIASNGDDGNAGHDDAQRPEREESGVAAVKAWDLLRKDQSQLPRGVADENEYDTPTPSIERDETLRHGRIGQLS